jgi:hypothetical protein
LGSSETPADFLPRAGTRSANIMRSWVIAMGDFRLPASVSSSRWRYNSNPGNLRNLTDSLAKSNPDAETGIS